MLYNLYSIGHGNKNIDSFITILDKFKPQLLVDIRSVPYSKTFPEYNKKNLIKKLREKNISYEYFGDKLGGRPENGFSNFVDTSEFKKNVGKLLSLSRNQTVILMCSEFDYMKCHRKFISEIIRKSGIDIKDIDKNGDIVQEEQFSIKQYQK